MIRVFVRSRSARGLCKSHYMYATVFISIKYKYKHSFTLAPARIHSFSKRKRFMPARCFISTNKNSSLIFILRTFIAIYHNLIFNKNNKTFERENYISMRLLLVNFVRSPVKFYQDHFCQDSHFCLAKW